ncbi:peptidoglycan bridge formation protein FemAB [Thiohalorhabdus denitrificans]|uniref:FemAB-related protein, PEP-CTERM system-associated n=1 Tax=Thiohalorhabdus denitrificans TaxID=381306 RepID=A0A0P9CTN8_9GAMM|nr:FemAB family XrtA/PEP-CTERM system-associated protein [Thiohalorhabdus denitrificans]KPV40020.1 peptidoglycan bridge formation protein FemAB [Thiohalorhabdus denitrificans]SCY12319.1 FemAB-related protein, PEP-CTERM system-associated [Thiohalorhabdus denitrificans]
MTVTGITDPVIREMGSGEEARWDAFVDAAPEATFFHRAGWRRVLEEGLGHRAHFLFAERNGEVDGILPLGRIRSRLFGDALISLPFCVRAGVVGRSEETRAALERAACDLADRLGVDHLELRQEAPRNPDWPTQSERYVHFRRALDPDPEANLKAIPRKQRAMIRKGMEAGLEGVVDDDLERFYPLYAESVRNLGTPVFPKRYLRTLREVFGDDCEVLTIEHRGQAVSSVLSFYFRDEVLPYYGGGGPAARDLKANDFMYWDLMRRAVERGYAVFDYGRSKRDTGSYRFKKHWGFEPEPLYYEYHLVRGQEIPDVSPSNPRYRVFVDAWKRLPLPMARVIGPVIARNLG